MPKDKVVPAAGTGLVSVTLARNVLELPSFELSGQWLPCLSHAKNWVSGRLSVALRNARKNRNHDLDPAAKHELLSDPTLLANDKHMLSRLLYQKEQADELSLSPAPVWFRHQDLRQ